MTRKIIGAILAIPILGTLGLYLAGTFYFLFNHGNISQVTPLTIIEYWQAHHNIVQYQKHLTLSILGALIISVVIPLIMIFFADKGQEELHGSARFATMKELRDKGLLSGKGILIGQFKGQYLVFTGSQFVFIAAPTRSGKGVSIAVPNMLSWHGSMVVLDLKQEGFSLTSKYRAKHGQEVYLFNPFTEDGQTHGYNPLFYVRDGDFCISDILTIANSFYPASDPKNKFWDEQACNLFLGLALLVKETPEWPFTIGEMMRQSSGKGQEPQAYIKQLIKERQNSRPLSEPCVDALNRFLALSDNSLANVLASFNAPMTNWINPIFDAATSRNDFDLRDLRKRRMTIYIGITPDYLPQAGRILNLFFSQLVSLNMKELPEHNAQLKYQCLLMMDEFTAMGKIAILAKSVSYLAGYGLRLLTIVQSPSQLEESTSEGGYGKEGARNYMSNHAAQVVFAPKDNEDAEDYSKMIGYKTVKSTSQSHNTGRSGGSLSHSDQRRAVMLPQEVKEMGATKQVINMENIKPIFCDKICYYNDPVFINRLKTVSPSLYALGRKLPTEEQLKYAVRHKELEVVIPHISLSSATKHIVPNETDNTIIPTSTPETVDKSHSLESTSWEHDNSEFTPDF